MQRLYIYLQYCSDTHIYFYIVLFRITWVHGMFNVVKMHYFGRYINKQFPLLVYFCFEKDAAFDPMDNI